MEFPITDLLSPDESTQWILQCFHPQGLMCPNCSDPVANAYVFCTTKKSHLTVYRCCHCNSVYNLYSNTIFQQRHLTPQQVVLLLRGLIKGEASTTLAAELKVSLQTVLDVRRDLQDSARFLQPNTPLMDERTETDEMFQNAGEKSEKHCDPLHPPRRRANNQRGRGIYADNRPPIVGTIGRESGQVRLRVVQDTTGKTPEGHVHQFTRAAAVVYTAESNSCHHIIRYHATVEHSIREYARDDDGDYIREVHCNTVEGMWTDPRNFLRPFKGVHKKYLAGYVAICEFRRNLKRVSPALISALVTFSFTVYVPTLYPKRGTRKTYPSPKGEVTAVIFNTKCI